jgi:hypothetical protein
MKTINFISLLVLAILLWRCQKDLEIQPKEFPFVITNDATQIDSTGVTFNAKILDFGKEEIIDFGFTWKSERGKYICSLKESGNIKDFSFRISSDLNNGEGVGYRAFVKTRTNTVYANTINFVSKGSKKPVIKDFYPKEGYDSTKVTIIGSDFSYNPGNNHVTINGLNVELVQSSNDTLVVILPETNINGVAEIMVQVGENKVVANEKFHITGPVITGISINEGYSGDFIIITGNNLLKRNEFTLYFGELKASILEIDNNKIKAIVPSNYIDAFKEYKAKIIFSVNTKVTESNDEFLIKSSWHKKIGLGLWLSNSKIVTYNNKAYVLEQSRPVMHQYDPVKDQWEKQNSSENPTIRHEKSLHIVIGDSLYFVGGNIDFVPSNKLWVFDFSQKKWYKKGNLPFSFITATYFFLDNDVHVVTNDGRHWICDFINEKYVELNKFPEKFDDWSYFGFGFISENRIFLVTVQNTFEYDKISDTWTKIANNSFVNSGYNAPPVGFNYSDNGYVFYPSTNTIYKFNLEENKWLYTAFYPEWVSDFARFSIFILNDMVYIEDLDDYNTNMVGYKNE